MLGKGLLVFIWFPLTFILILCNLWLLAGSYQQLPVQAHKTQPIQSNHNITASNDTAKILNSIVIAGDARALLLKSFLDEHTSPMAPFADLIVEEADKHGLDYRIVVAIAMCESNLGKRIPSSDSYNAFGIAVYSNQKTGKKFDNWEHAITWVSQYLKEKYYDQGITNLRDIGAKWAPPSVENGYSWSNCVDTFLTAIQ